jgi:hypothetical protein
LPGDWWLDCCIQLYRAGEDAVACVAGEQGGRFHDLEWASINDLPLAGQSQQLFQRAMSYWGAGHPNAVAAGQIILDQARLAIALEQYRLEAGRYPATLAELVPAQIARIPIDVEVGRPMLYEPVASGSYLLRGLGRNHRNDRTAPNSDDILWAYPTNRPAIHAGSAKPNP